MKSAKRAAQITIKKVKESDKMEKKGKGEFSHFCCQIIGQSHLVVS
jgi:hypothetical protein